MLDGVVADGGHRRDRRPARAQRLGKSTLLRVVAGLHVPDGGRVVLGRRATSPACRRTAAASGWCSRTSQLFPHRTWPPTWASGCACRARRRAAIDAPGGRAARRSSACPASSGGGWPRCRAARPSGWRWPARSPPSPAVLLLDEPLGALDRDLHDRLAVDVRHLLAARRHHRRARHPRRGARPAPSATGSSCSRRQRAAVASRAGRATGGRHGRRAGSLRRAVRRGTHGLRGQLRPGTRRRRVGGRRRRRRDGRRPVGRLRRRGPHHAVGARHDHQRVVVDEDGHGAVRARCSPTAASSTSTRRWPATGPSSPPTARTACSCATCCRTPPACRAGRSRSRSRTSATGRRPPASSPPRRRGGSRARRRATTPSPRATSSARSCAG